MTSKTKYRYTRPGASYTTHTARGKFVEWKANSNPQGIQSLLNGFLGGGAGKIGDMLSM